MNKKLYQRVVNDLRGEERARRGNEKLNLVPERDEIERALKDMKDSSPFSVGGRSTVSVRSGCV